MESEWEKDGLIGQEVSWSVGFGPRTHAYVLKPANAKGPFPGLLPCTITAISNIMGKEKIADGPEEPLPVLNDFRQIPYGGRAYANALAREGFVVLVHDVFLWGSRRFPLDTMLEMMGNKTAAMLLRMQTNLSVQMKSSVITMPLIFMSIGSRSTAIFLAPAWRELFPSKTALP